MASASHSCYRPLELELKAFQAGEDLAKCAHMGAVCTLGRREIGPPDTTLQTTLGGYSARHHGLSQPLNVVPPQDSIIKHGNVLRLIGGKFNADARKQACRCSKHLPVQYHAQRLDHTVLNVTSWNLCWLAHTVVCLLVGYRTSVTWQGPGLGLHDERGFVLCV